MPDARELEESTVTEPVPDNEFDEVVGIVADGVVGAAGGLVGTAMMTVVLATGESFGVFSRDSFAVLTTLVGLEGVFPPVTFGYLLFLAGGMVTWPLLFASLKGYLPGESDPVSGAAFGATLWTGFVFAFYSGFSGLTLVGYLLVTLVAHLVYGAGLGLVFQYFTTRPDTLV
jgi:hypothetical protein